MGDGRRPANGKPAYMKIRSTSGGMARKKSIPATAAQRATRKCESDMIAQARPPAQAKRNDENTNKDRLPEAGKDERQRSLHDRQIEELLNDRFHHTLRQANRISSRRPSTTTGMNRITYAIAPIMSGVALPENDCAV